MNPKKSARTAADWDGVQMPTPMLITTRMRSAAGLDADRDAESHGGLPGLPVN